MTSSPLSGESLALPTELIHYIQSLNEPIEKYTPYFDALLIKRRNQPSFFRDLRSFRCQEHVIALLTTPSDTPDFDVKVLYRQCSRMFLESRFAHPWCRTTPGATKDGWFTAEWGKIKKQSEAKRREEERLHRLLVPIWCGFRVRMMPSDEQLQKFVEREKQIEERRRETLGSDEAVKRGLEGAGERAEGKDAKPPSSATGRKKGAEEARRQTTDHIPSAQFNAEAFVSEDDDRIHEQYGNGDNDGAATAAKMFIGVAATSFLAQNPRVRKYLYKKLQK